MASNKIPEDYDSVVQHLEDAADGANVHGVAVGHNAAGDSQPSNPGTTPVP
jgi:hypothetical protein